MISRKHRSLNWGRAAPTGQQRKVKIQEPEGRLTQHRFRNDHSESDYHREINAREREGQELSLARWLYDL
jgi:hypothetical protein